MHTINYKVIVYSITIFMFFFSQPNSPFTFLSQLLRMVFSSFSMWAKSSEKFTITYYKAQNFCHWHKETNIGPYQLPKCCMHLMLFCTVDHFQSKRMGKNYKKRRHLLLWWEISVKTWTEFFCPFLLLVSKYSPLCLLVEK